MLVPTKRVLLLAALAASPACSETPLPDFELRDGDRICLVGNALADRMQHDGWLETALQSRFPDQRLVLRNLGFAGDEVTMQMRSANFGTADDHLRRSAADVVFVFFGYNESFTGTEGASQFKQDLSEYVRHTLNQQYNGTSAPRLVLFSPIAHENLESPVLPTGTANNSRLESYTAVIEQVAEAHGVRFVDLFSPSRELYASEETPLTINGVHLSEAGNREIAAVIEKSLFPNTPRLPRDSVDVETLRTAILDKNLHWFNRYRTTDGYSIFGQRGELKFVDDQTNREVINRELEILDVMVANRDQRIWAVANGGDLQVDDSNTPPFLPVETNIPGEDPDGTHTFLGGEEAIARMTIAEGMAINLFASEEQFPDLVNPNQSAIDPEGRLWVSAWPTYPHWKPKDPVSDKLLILPDDDGDGRADRCIVFAQDLHNPTGFEFWGGGVLVAQVPDVLFLKDTDGDDRADVRIRMINGIDSADTHHSINSFVIDPGGALYFQEGTFHQTQVETPYGPPVRNSNAAVYRYEPRTQKFDVFASYGFANPHGHVFDRWGQDFVTDGTGSEQYLGASFSGRVNFPRKHPRAPRVFPQRTRPCPGTAILSSGHFPPENQGNWLVGNVIGFQGILQYKFEDNDSGFTAREVEPIVFSSDPNFRPTDMEIGADGALYFTEWQNPIIGHMQHNLRDPSRDRLHGRVYRVTYPSRPLLEPTPIATAPTAELVQLLEAKEDSTRSRTRAELSNRPTDEVIAAVREWTNGLDPTDQDYEHHMLEALWMHQHHDRVDEQLLDRMLRSTDYRARAAATRVLCYWRDRVQDPVTLLRVQANDAHPRVRLEAVRACSFFPSATAAEVALEAAKYPLDRFLEYTLQETLTTLRPQWRASLRSGSPFAEDNTSGLEFLLEMVDATELVELPRVTAVLVAILDRPGVTDSERLEALNELAAQNDTEPLDELLTAVKRRDGIGGGSLIDLGRILAGWDTTELERLVPDLIEMTQTAAAPIAREAGYAAWIAGADAAASAWEKAANSESAQLDLLRAIPLLDDHQKVLGLYPAIQPLMFSGPTALRPAAIIALGFVPGPGVERFANFSRLIQQGEHRDAAIRSMLRIPREEWPIADAQSLAPRVLEIATNTPLAERNEPPFEWAVELGQELAGALPPPDADALRNAISDLAPLIIRIRSIPGKMLYDRTEFTVVAGKPVRIVFENPDQMPHNLLIVEPGSTEEVGMMAERMGIIGERRHFRPSSDKILYATNLIKLGETATLDFVAPTELGDYGYLCTYPAHWRLMQGIMRVVAPR